MKNVKISTFFFIFGLIIISTLFEICLNSNFKQKSILKRNSSNSDFNFEGKSALKLKSFKNDQSIKEDKQNIKDICYIDIHKPYKEENESSFYVLIITALLMLILRFFKKLICSNSMFAIRSMTSVLSYNLVYCACFSIFFILFSYGVFDVFTTNIEKVFIGFVIFSFVWNIYLIFICISFSSYNDFLKSFDDKNYDFKSLKVEYERAVNSKYNLNKLDESFRSDTSNTISKNIDATLNFFSLLVMKYYFILPFEPKFRSFKLKKDFPFGSYISECLLQELRGFFSITWTSVISFLTLVVVWTQIIEIKQYHILIIMLLPVVIIILQSCLTLYLIYVKNKFIPNIDENNYLDYQGIEKLASSGNFDIFIYPEYISNLLVIKNGLDNIATLNSNTEEERIVINKVNKNLAILENMDLSKFGYSMTQHFNIRSNSFFEDNMILGRPGLFILKHINQILNLSLSVWFVLLNDKYFYYSKTIDSQSLIIRTIIGLILSVIYFVIMLFLTRSNLKVLNLISNTESNKNEEIIKKMIHLSTIKHSNQLNRISEEFRKMSFDICSISKNKNSKLQNTLGKKILKDIVDFSLLRFKDIEEKNLKNSKERLNALKLSVSENFHEFKSYIRSVSGQHLSENDLENLFHLIENREKIKKEKNLSFVDIYDIWGGLIFLSSLDTDKCIRIVVDHFQSIKNIRDDEFNLDCLKEFLEWAHEYISKEDKDFLYRECKEFKSHFNKEFFIGFMSASTSTQAK